MSALASLWLIGFVVGLGVLGGGFIVVGLALIAGGSVASTARQRLSGLEPRSGWPEV